MRKVNTSMRLFRKLIRNIRDAFKSVFRNLSLSMASILCITITLIVVSIAMVASVNVNNFTKKITEYLNAVFSSGGNKVLNELINADWALAIVNNFGKYNDPYFDEAKGNRFGVLFAGALMSSKYEVSLGVETIAHEVFHAFQFLKGQGGASIYNEVEAFAFGYMIYGAFQSNLDVFQHSISGEANPESVLGTDYANAFSRLTSGKSNYNIAFNDAMNLFKDGSRVNMTGLYSALPMRLDNQKRLLLYEYYPK